MIREAKPIQLKNHLATFQNEIKKECNTTLFSKKLIWDAFTSNQPENYIIGLNNSEIIYTILKYFRGSSDFNSYGIIKNKASLDKGILIHGDYGVGKSLLFEILHKTGKQLYKEHRFKNMRFDCISTGSFVDDYMRSVKLNDSNFNINRYYKHQLYIDDLGFEKKAFLDFELLAQVLFERHRNKEKTFVTTNLSPSEITARYSELIGDRLPEMFNIIKWEGESLRE